MSSHINGNGGIGFSSLTFDQNIDESLAAYDMLDLLHEGNNEGNNNKKRRLPPVFGRERELDLLRRKIQSTIRRGRQQGPRNSLQAAEEDYSLALSALDEDAEEVQAVTNFLMRIILIHGPAGCGKSSLVEEPRLLPKEQAAGMRDSKERIIYFTYGKFENSKQVYRGMGAIGKLLKGIAERLDATASSESIKKVKDAFTDADKGVLRDIWPQDMASIFPILDESTADMKARGEDDTLTTNSATTPLDPSASATNLDEDDGFQGSESVLSSREFSSSVGLASGDIENMLGISNTTGLQMLKNLVYLFSRPWHLARIRRRL